MYKSSLESGMLKKKIIWKLELVSDFYAFKHYYKINPDLPTTD